MARCSSCGKTVDATEETDKSRNPPSLYWDSRNRTLLSSDNANDLERIWALNAESQRARWALEDSTRCR